VIASSYSFAHFFLDFLQELLSMLVARPVAMEGDKDIFKAILEPLILDPITEGLKKQQLEATNIANDLEDEELPDTYIIPFNRYCK
jgi:hypothetical protein